jgi:flagellar biosynthesis/type III secretory pathway chaperone
MQKNIDLLYESLLLFLKQEYEQYQALCKCLKEEALIMKKSKLENILASNARKEAIVLSLKVAAEMRDKAVNKIATHFNITQPISTSNIIAHTQGNTRQILFDYQEKFADVIEEIKKVNENNKNMISLSLSHTRNTLNYINSLLSSNPNYNHLGHIKAENLQGRLISQAG